jgi:acyl-CoA synthetase (AMP-forming)/AMP-acid ligase II
MATTSEPADVRRAHRSELTPLAFLERSVLVYPDKVAVVHEGRRHTYRQFGERVNRLASALRAAGVRKGSPDPVASKLGDEDEPISINYTSGTTGRPKGAVYHYRGAYLNALGEVIETRLTPESVYLWTLPMFHCNGWCFTWAVAAVGGRHVCLRKVEPGRVWELIDGEGVTHYNGAPTVQAMILDHEKAHKLDHEIMPKTSTGKIQKRNSARGTGRDAAAGSARVGRPAPRPAAP